MLTLAGRHYLGPGVKLPKDWISEPQGNGGTASLAIQPEVVTNYNVTSPKLQAALTMDPGTCRMSLEREENMEVKQLKRIADAIEEILRLVKKDMEPKK